MSASPSDGTTAAPTRAWRTAAGDGEAPFHEPGASGGNPERSTGPRRERDRRDRRMLRRPHIQRSAERRSAAAAPDRAVHGPGRRVPGRRRREPGRHRPPGPGVRRDGRPRPPARGSAARVGASLCAGDDACPGDPRRERGRADGRRLLPRSRRRAAAAGSPRGRRRRGDRQPLRRRRLARPALARRTAAAVPLGQPLRPVYRRHPGSPRLHLGASRRSGRRRSGPRGWRTSGRGATPSR